MTSKTSPKTPYFTISKDIALKQYNKIKDLADMISYSSKTNQETTKILEKNTNCMFSIHLKNELKHVKDLSRVIFLAQAWNTDLIDDLIKKGINWFVIDNEKDLQTLNKVLDNTDHKVNILLRWKLKENTIKTEKYYIFGMQTEKIEQKIKELKDNKNIESLGIHFHRKTQNLAEWDIKFELENSFSKDTLTYIDHINIGGGLPIQYANTNIDVLKGILAKIKDLRSWLNNQNIKLMLEPGRFIAGPAGKLHSTVIGIHENTIIIDASVYNGDLDAIVVPVKLKIQGELKKESPQCPKPYIIKGITPCSMDIFRYKAYLKDIKVGDKITFINAGAYNFNSDFCDLKPVNTILTD